MGAVDRLAPFDLAEPWDHVGLQVGSPGDEGRRRAGRTSRSTTPRWTRPRRLGVRPAARPPPADLRPARASHRRHRAGRLALRAAREGVAVIAAHTNLDKAHGGIADVIAGAARARGGGAAGAGRRRRAQAGRLRAGGRRRPGAQGAVRRRRRRDRRVRALLVVGRGQGTFFGREGSDPAAGWPAATRRSSELRLEVVFPRRLRRRVTGAYVAAHPYEEPAFDLYPVENEVATLGLGRLGVLPAARAAGGLRRRRRGRAAPAVGALRRRRRPRGAARRRAAGLRRRGHRPRRRPGRRRARHRRRQVSRGARARRPRAWRWSTRRTA